MWAHRCWRGISALAGADRCGDGLDGSGCAASSDGTGDVKMMFHVRLIRGANVRTIFLAVLQDRYRLLLILRRGDEHAECALRHLLRLGSISPSSARVSSLVRGQS